jgi:integrase
MGHANRPEGQPEDTGMSHNTKPKNPFPGLDEYAPRKFRFKHGYPQRWVYVPAQFSASRREAYAYKQRTMGKGPAPQLVPTVQTFIDYATEAINNHAKAKRSSRRTYMARLHSERVQPLHRMRISKIGPDTIQRLILRPMLDDGLSGNTIHATLGALSVVFSSAAEDKLIETNPVSVLPKRKIPERRIRPRVYVLSADDLRRLLELAPEQHEAVIAVAGLVGARLSEILGLRWQDIDFDQQLISFEYQRDYRTSELVYGMKTDKENEAGGRTVVMPLTLIPYLRQQLQRCGLNRRDDDLLFPDISQRAIQDWLRNNRERLGRNFDGSNGYKPLSMHTLRHSYGSRLLESGASITFVAAQMGDQPLTVMRTYAHEIRESDNAKARELIERVFG